MLWFGLSLLKQCRIQQVLIFEDSQLVISQASTTGNENTHQSSALWICIQNMLKSFQTIQTLQNIRSLNNEEDEQANKGVKLKIGEVNLNGAHVNNVIPP